MTRTIQMAPSPRWTPDLIVSAERLAAHSPERIYAFLAELENHRHLSDRYLRLDRLSAKERGGQITICAPFGIRRTARTTVTTALAPQQFGGRASVGMRTHAHAFWRIEPSEQGARVALEATVSAAGVLDRLLLTFGGRWWLRRCFERVLGSLVSALDQAPVSGATA